MRKALLTAGIVAVAIPFYDEVALATGKAAGQQTLPFIWENTFGDSIPEIWSAILGAILILLAIFL